jgi:hypothetical protein
LRQAYNYWQDQPGSFSFFLFRQIDRPPSDERVRTERDLVFVTYLRLRASLV